jgi:hypothetical protein
MQKRLNYPYENIFLVNYFCNFECKLKIKLSKIETIINQHYKEIKIITICAKILMICIKKI